MADAPQRLNPRVRFQEAQVTDNDKYEQDRLEKLNSIAIGGKDKSGREVYAVYAKGDEFAIYSIGKEGTIRQIAIYIGTKDPDDEKLINNFQSVKGELDKLKSISEKASDNSFSARVAHALSVAILGDPQKAKNILDEIQKDIIESYKEKVVGKLIYITGTFLVAAIIGAFALYLYICQPALIVESRSAFYEITLLCAFSTFGGLISVSRGLTKIDVEKGLGHLPYFLHGIERNVFSVIGGAFIYVLIKSNLLFGFVVSLDNQFHGLMVFGFLAGFSETLIPNALKNLEERANNESNKNN